MKRLLGCVGVACLTLAIAYCGSLAHSQTEGGSAKDITPAALAVPYATGPRQVVHLELAGIEKGTMPLGFGTCQWLEPLQAAPKKLLAEPKYESDKPIYYAAHFGDAKDNCFTLVLDESKGPGKGYDVLYADLNSDNCLEAKEEQFHFQMGDTIHAESVRLCFQITTAGITTPYYVSFTAFPYKDDSHPVENIHVNLRDCSYYEGDAEFQGKRRKIAIADLNSNGRFNDVERGLFQGDRFFDDLNDDGKFDGDRDPSESFPYGKFTQIAGEWYSIVASPDGSQVEITPVRPPQGTIEVSPEIVSAMCVSPEQTLYLNFEGGKAQGVEGTYHVYSLELLAKGEPPKGFRLFGSFSGKPRNMADDGGGDPSRPNPRPELVIRGGQTVQVKAGLPLKVSVKTIPKGKEGELELSLLITGAGGEIYTWHQRNPSSPKAGFEIVDAEGKKIESGEFEYG
jgi:hypothetical protein